MVLYFQGVETDAQWWDVTDPVGITEMKSSEQFIKTAHEYCAPQYRLSKCPCVTRFNKMFVHQPLHKAVI